MMTTIKRINLPVSMGWNPTVSRYQWTIEGSAFGGKHSGLTRTRLGARFRARKAARSIIARRIGPNR